MSSEPGQDLEHEARTLLFPSRNDGHVSGQEEPEVEIGIDEIEDASLLDMVEGAAGAIDIDIGPEGSDNDPIQLVPSKAPGVAIERHGTHGAALPMGHKGSPLHNRTRTPSAPIGNGRKSNKRSRVDSALESISSEQSQLADLARGSYDIKMATIESKQKKAMFLSEREQDVRRIAAQERELILKQEAKEREIVLMQKGKERELEIQQQMQDSKFAHIERIMKYQLELARCGVPMVGAPALGAHPVGLEQEYPSTNACPSNIDVDGISLPFSTGTTTAFPSAWGLPEASTSQP